MRGARSSEIWFGVGKVQVVDGGPEKRFAGDAMRYGLVVVPLQRRDQLKQKRHRAFAQIPLAAVHAVASTC